MSGLKASVTPNLNLLVAEIQKILSKDGIFISDKQNIPDFVKGSFA